MVGTAYTSFNNLAALLINSSYYTGTVDVKLVGNFHLSATDVRVLVMVNQPQLYHGELKHMISPILTCMFIPCILLALVCS